MDRCKIHVTDIDGFQWFKKMDSMTTKDMVDRLLRTSGPNEQMMAGTALHAIMEDPPDEIGTIERDGFTFTFDCDASVSIPPVREIRQSKKYFIDDVIVTLTGKCDGIEGNRVDDHKLTFKPTPENYMESFQWRAYLDIFNADSFRYIIYSAKKDRKDTSRITIYDVSEMTLYRYPGMEKDLILGVSELLGFIKSHVPQISGSNSSAELFKETVAKATGIQTYIAAQ